MYYFASVNETQKQKTVYFIPRITQNHKIMADKETSIFFSPKSFEKLTAPVVDL